MMVKVAEVCPCGTVRTEAEGIATVLLLPMVTA